MSDQIADIADIAEFFRDYAAQGYSNKSAFQPTSDAIDVGIFQRFTALSKRVSQPTLDKVNVAFNNVGVSGYRELDTGSDSVCLKSADKAIRVGRLPNQAIPRRVEMGRTRDNCPLIVQPEHKIVSVAETTSYEVLPYLVMLDDSEIPDFFQKSLSRIIQNTCFELNGEFKDLAVLPDGTPIYVDPGAINLKDWNRQPSEADFQTIRANAESMGWPDDLNWVQADGSFKQYAFFPAPQNAINIAI